MNGRRYSRQRELIYQVLMGTDQHPTAEMVYHWLKPANPNLSLGTVYRNLNLLVEEGKAIRLAFPVERYDSKTEPHSHFRCDQCGGVFDIELPYEKGIDRTANDASKHDIRWHELIFHGTCYHCKQIQS